jgi:TPR repeat protein
MTAFLLTWKETGWPHENIVRMVATLEAQGHVDEPWRVAAQNMAKPGDRVWVLKQGRGPKGIFGVGAQFLMKPRARSVSPPNIACCTASARVVFQRAADAGNANAAMALGATYDPNVLGKLGVVGVSADLEQARSWYRKAENLGSPDARERLEVLADH